MPDIINLFVVFDQIALKGPVSFVMQLYHVIISYPRDSTFTYCDRDLRSFAYKCIMEMLSNWNILFCSPVFMVSHGV